MNETTETTSTISDKLDHAFSALAEQMGVATDYFWPLFVRQQMIEGVGFFASVFVALLFVTFLAALIYRHRKNEDVYVPCVWVGALVLLMCVITCLFDARYNLSKIINPEYHAIQEVLEVVK